MKKYEIKITPRSEREVMIRNRTDSSSDTDTLWDFRGDKATLKVVRLPINVPVYRVDNCRTYSEQQDIIAKNGFDETYFTKGQELSTVQTSQHEILLRITKSGPSSVSSILDVLHIGGQRDPILITSTGVVVNGNRRLSAIRELCAADSSVNSKWAFVKCLVLPPDTSPEEVDDIEANEQARPQTKLDYDWIGDAQLVRRQVSRKGDTRLVAQQLRRSDSDVKNLLQAIGEADLYLNEWACKPSQYSLVSGDAEQIFGDLPKRLSGKTVPMQNASRAIAWSLFENRDKLPGRVYAFNAAFGKLASVVLANIAEQLDLPMCEVVEDGDDDGFSIDIDGGGTVEDYSAVIVALKDPATKADAIEALIEASQSAIETDAGRRSKGAALKALAQVHAKLAGIDFTTAGVGTYGGLGKQLESIRELVTKLQAKLKTLQKLPPGRNDD